jgi:hypothetical protein
MITPEELGKRLRQARELVGIKQDPTNCATRSIELFPSGFQPPIDLYSAGSIP